MKSILVIGLGRFGRHIAQKFIAEGNSVLAIECDMDRADNAAEFIPNVQIGNTTDEHYISTLGVDNFDICVVAIGENFQSALETTVLLKDYGAKFVLGRATREVHRKLLLRNGADDVVYSERDTAERLAVKYGAKNIFDYIELTDEISIYEIAVPSAWIGKSILENAIRTKYDVSILAIKKNGKLFPQPSPDHIFNNDETVMIMGANDKIKALT